jgi:hypothetical protein
MITETIELEPKEKAKQLLDKFKFADIYFVGGNETMLQNAKNCALLCVEMIQAELIQLNSNKSLDLFNYYQDVNKELKKL